MTLAIEIDAVHKHYGATHALRGVSFNIARGEFFGLLGPNGAGKSTLINILAGLTRASSGTARVAGRDVVKDFARTRRALGVVPQELVFDPFFNVREVLRIQAGYFGLGRENYAWIDELIDTLMLTDKAEANMRSLSGGMKRRVLVAQALVHKPEVVVLDEPTAGVDVELRQSLWAFIQRLHRDGHTIVLTTHYLEEAEQLCERIAILNHGELAALDSKPALLARGLGKVLMISTAAPISVLPELLRPKVKSHNGNTLEFDLDIARDSIGEILDALRAAGATITDIHTQEPDLEDIFLQITQRGKT
jgi:ABC-2 type transport system ATP-binding protein